LFSSFGLQIAEISGYGLSALAEVLANQTPWWSIADPILNSYAGQPWCQLSVAIVGHLISLMWLE